MRAATDHVPISEGVPRPQPRADARPRHAGRSRRRGAADIPACPIGHPYAGRLLRPERAAAEGDRPLPCVCAEGGRRRHGDIRRSPARPCGAARDLHGVESRAQGFGPTALYPLQGAVVPFAPTEAARKEVHDPRPSIAERYADNDAYVAAVRREAARQVAERLLLPEDAERAVEAAKQGKLAKLGRDRRMGRAQRNPHRSAYAVIAPMGFARSTHPTPGLNRKTLAPRSTLQRHQSASNQPELILKLLRAVDPGLGGYGRFSFDWPRGSGNEANHHVAGIGVVVCDRRHPLDHRQLIRANGHGQTTRPQPWWRCRNPSSRRARNRPSRRFPLRCSMTCRRDRLLDLKRLLAGSSHPAHRRRRARPRRRSRPCHSLQQRPRPLSANPVKPPKQASSRWKATLGQPENPKTATRNCPASGERPTPGHADRQADFRIYCDD